MIEVNFFVNFFFFLNLLLFLFVRKGHWGIETITFGAASTMIGELQHNTSYLSVTPVPFHTR